MSVSILSNRCIVVFDISLELAKKITVLKKFSIPYVPVSYYHLEVCKLQKCNTAFY